MTDHIENLEEKQLWCCKLLDAPLCVVGIKPDAGARRCRWLSWCCSGIDSLSDEPVRHFPPSVLYPQFPV